MIVRFTCILLLALVSGCSSRRTVQPEVSRSGSDDTGVLLMAHGGSTEWNDEILDAVTPLRKQYTVEVAFGMADAATIQEAVRRLEDQGISRIAVVRLFISGESWYDRTRQILGLLPGAPTAADEAGQASRAGHANHSAGFWRVETASAFALTTEGLANADAMGDVLADRARTLSSDPQREAVLILAHGPGDDTENDRWIAEIDARAENVRRALPFSRVQVMTLREDWPEKRVEAERRIREFVSTAGGEGLTPIVIPFRVYGFGPYGQVLDGLEYVADGRGLLPHLEVTNWIADQVLVLRDGTFQSAADSATSPGETMHRTVIGDQ